MSEVRQTAVSETAGAVSPDNPSGDEPVRRGPEIPLHELLDLTWDPPVAGSGTAAVHMPVAENAFGHNANLHGGAIATLVDLACALAATQTTQFDMATTSLVTTDMHVRYLARPRTEVVTATASVLRAGSQSIVVDCAVCDGSGRRVAQADVGMMLVTSRRPVLDDIVARRGVVGPGDAPGSGDTAGPGHSARQEIDGEHDREGAP